MAASFPFSQAVVDILAAGNAMIVYAVQLHFKDGTVYGHTGTGDLIIDGQVYHGAGGYASVGSSEESNNASSPMSVDITLSGLDAEAIADTLLDGCRGRPAKLMFVAIDPDGNYAADALFSGRMDAAQFSYGGNDGDNAITVTIIDRMAEWNRIGTERWTDENHRARHGGDRFFFAVAQLANSPIAWGAKKDAAGFVYQ